MCGICGFVNKSPIVDLTPIKQMQNALHHRGPDGGGEYYHSHLALAIRRLSIIDLSRGWRPFTLEIRYQTDSDTMLIEESSAEEHESHKTPSF